jgi:hypothetical protein
LQRFGRAAAGRIVGLLQKAQTAAVAWGRTILNVVEGVESLPRRGPKSDRNEKKPHTFLASSGEPFSHPVQDHSASTAVARLARWFGCSELFTLRGVPLRIPPGMAGEEGIIRRFVNHYKDYGRIFGSHGAVPLIGNIDAFLTGVGDTASSKEDTWFTETVDTESLSNLDEIAIGNIGGIWLPHEDGNQEEVINKLNSRWLGIQLHQIERCADRKTDQDGPGVIVVAAGREKASIVRRTLPYVNHLLIDQFLADAML